MRNITQDILQSAFFDGVKDGSLNEKKERRQNQNEVNEFQSA